MNSDKEVSEEHHDDRQVATRPSDLSMLSGSDMQISPELFQQYISIERRRNFRALCWVSSTFLLVVVAVAAIIITIGLAFMKDSKKAVELADSASKSVDQYKNRVDNLGAETRTAVDKVAGISVAVQEDKRKYNLDQQILRQDLLGFSKWYDARYSSVTGSVATMSDLSIKLAALERLERERSEKFKEIEKWYQDNKTRLASASPLPDRGVIALGNVATATNVPAIEPGQQEASGNSSTETRTYSNGDSYAGEFKNGVRHGRGTYVHSSGDRYEGEFKNGKRNGTGTYRYTSGEIYQGEFKDDRKNGHGVCIYADGTKVKGLWQNDVMVQNE